MICFDIADKIKLILEFPDDNIERFSSCKVLYKYNEMELNIYEDFLYVFIADMLAMIRNIPVLPFSDMFGKIGKWQEYFYYKRGYVKRHSKEIEVMDRARFIDTAKKVLN